ncbi:hypothetical protein N7494_012563 [Penicillium frequentans]|uniref:Uncharacterized protein n=1 Tax=Penicillium frequentans TaxID=3151616 RepID=A0AAD6CLS3_9EURO|nr:hypothetical protein N7494_012563 [Penicillium glabrum]
MDDPVPLPWKKSKGPMEKPGLAFDACYDYTTLQQWQEGEQYAGLLKGAAMAQAKPPLKLKLLAI